MYPPDINRPTANIPISPSGSALSIMSTLKTPAMSIAQTLNHTPSSSRPIPPPPIIPSSCSTPPTPLTTLSGVPPPPTYHAPNAYNVDPQLEVGQQKQQGREKRPRSQRMQPGLEDDEDDSLSDDTDSKFGAGGVLDEFVTPLVANDEYLDDADEIEEEEEEEDDDGDYKDNQPPRRGPGRPPRSSYQKRTKGSTHPYKKRKYTRRQDPRTPSTKLSSTGRRAISPHVVQPGRSSSPAIMVRSMSSATANVRVGRPTSAFPPGTNWKVGYDTVHIPFAHFEPKIAEKMLTYRTKEDGSLEFLVKYKHLSYQHRAWVGAPVIEGMTNGATRIKRFLDKYHSEQGGSAAAAWGDEAFNPAYLRIDRILDEGEVGRDADSKVFYLVKWEGLAYDQATWEDKDECEEWDSDAVNEFKNRRLVDQAKLKLMALGVTRPPLASWTPYTQSLEYRNGNSLRQYQLEGVNWLTHCWLRGQSSIMADEMGLGKTVQSVSFLHELYTTFNVPGPFLVIAPLSTVPHWEREFRTWTEMNVIVFHGNATSRNLIVDTEFYWKDAEGQVVPGLFKFDVVITTYEMVLASPAQLRPIPWRACVLDEAHKLKNKSSKITEMLKGFYMEHRVLLTGTPLQNDIGELWALLNFLEPDKFPDEKQFMVEYGSLKTSTDVERLQELLKPLMLRRLKEDVETSIPVKEETVVEVELTNIQKKWYRAILERNFSMLKKGTKGRDALPSLINIVMELRKCCIHPYLLSGAEDVILSESGAGTPDEQYKCMIQASGKLVLLDKLLVKLKLGGHKVLIFSQMTKCLDILQDYLRGRSYLYERIDGNIRGSERQAAIDRFSASGSESFVFLLCTRAGGVGINLTAADTAIIYDSDWNPQNDLQAQARCHRIGQKKPVQIYRLVTRNTYEKEMFDRAGLKLGLDRAVLQKMSADTALGTGDDHPGKLSKKEVEELLKKGAYGAFMDDSESAAFCDESIDQILERRATVIKHDNTPAVGSIFSKATFVANSSTVDNEIDVNDPDFWDKLAEKAQLDPYEAEPLETLILDEPRQRRSHAAAARQILETADDDAMYEDPLLNNPEAVKWSGTEKLWFERRMMVFGVWHWDRITQGLPRRTIDDLRACARDLLLFLTRVLDPSDDAQAIVDLCAMASEECEPYCFPQGSALPYEGASAKQVAEYRSFLVSAPPDYREGLAKKAKFMVSRLQLLKQVYDLVPRDLDVAKETVIVPHITRPPAEWWGAEEDRDLIIGVVKHGYHVFKPLRRDPHMVFSKRRYDPATFQELHRRAKKARKSTPAVQDNVAEDEESDIDDGPSVDESSLQGIEDQNLYAWPSKSELGARLRRIVMALNRENKRKLIEADHMRRFNAHVAAGGLPSESVQFEHRSLADSSSSWPGPGSVTEIGSTPTCPRIGKWNKRERTDFFRALCTYGLRLKKMAEEDGSSGGEYDRKSEADVYPGEMGSLHLTIDWTEIKQSAHLMAKTDEALLEYFWHMFAMCRSLVEAELVRNRGGVGLIRRPRSSWEGDDEYSIDKAKKLLKRVELLDVLRHHVLTRPNLEAELSQARKTSGLPDWWQVGFHDRSLLVGCARHGFGRYEAMIRDPSLGFFPLIGTFQFAKNEQDGSASVSPPLGTLLGLPWPAKDNILTRRIESLCFMIEPGKFSLDPTQYVPPMYREAETILVSLSAYFGRPTLESQTNLGSQNEPAAVSQEAIPLRSSARLAAVRTSFGSMGRRKLRLTEPPIVAVHDAIVAPEQPADVVGTTVTMDSVGPGGIRRTLVLYLPGNAFLSPDPAAEPDAEFVVRASQRVAQYVAQDNCHILRIPDHRYMLDEEPSAQNAGDFRNESPIPLPPSSSPYVPSLLFGSRAVDDANETLYVPSCGSVHASSSLSPLFQSQTMSPSENQSVGVSPNGLERMPSRQESPLQSPKVTLHSVQHSFMTQLPDHSSSVPRITTTVPSTSSSPRSHNLSTFKIRIKPINAPNVVHSPMGTSPPSATIKSPLRQHDVPNDSLPDFRSDDPPLKKAGSHLSMHVPASIPVSALLNGEPMEVSSESEMSEIMSNCSH